MAMRTRALADEEAPNGEGELLPGELVEPVVDEPAPKHMSGNMVGLGFGLAVGGDPLVAAEYSNGEERRITAAGGAEFAVTFAMTPLWAGVLGFGVSGELGWKLQLVSATNGEVSKPTTSRFCWASATSSEGRAASALEGAGQFFERRGFVVHASGRPSAPLGSVVASRDHSQCGWATSGTRESARGLADSHPSRQAFGSAAGHRAIFLARPDVLARSGFLNSS
jgi:hypothetical protein